MIACLRTVRVPADQREFIALNREMAEVCPPIVTKKAPLANG